MISRRMLLSVGIIMALFLSAIALPLSATDARAGNDASESMYLTVKLEGPGVLGAGVEGKFVLRISYFFKERIDNYSYTASIVGEDISGGAVSPNNGTSSKGVFNLTITGASEPGTMTVQINASAEEFGKKWYKVEEFDIEIVNSIVIRASIENKGYAPVTNVSVRMLVDGALIDEKRISINPISRIDVTFNWTFSSISEGRHVIMIIIDDPMEVAEFHEGNNVLIKEIYYATSGNWLRGFLAIGIMFIAFVLVMTLLQRSAKKPKT
ncbi:MAG: CARDB domain-containing protein [Thermoplasmata archaeon]